MTEIDETPMVCRCGLMMSRNPHPEAGHPGMEGLLIGHVWVCIPCTVASRQRWANRAMRAEAAISRHRTSVGDAESTVDRSVANITLWRTLWPVEKNVVDHDAVTYG